MIGIPAGYRVVTAEPDTEPAEFPTSRAVRAAWITDEIVEELTND